MIKPTNEGSSLGVYICKNEKQFNKNYKKLKINMIEFLVKNIFQEKKFK